MKKEKTETKKEYIERYIKSRGHGTFADKRTKDYKNKNKYGVSYAFIAKSIKRREIKEIKKSIFEIIASDIRNKKYNNFYTVNFCFNTKKAYIYRKLHSDIGYHGISLYKISLEQGIRLLKLQTKLNKGEGILQSNIYSYCAIHYFYEFASMRKTIVGYIEKEQKFWEEGIDFKEYLDKIQNFDEKELSYMAQGYDNEYTNFTRRAAARKILIEKFCWKTVKLYNEIFNKENYNN